jgi:hypothetical protein
MVRLVEMAIARNSAACWRVPATVRSTFSPTTGLAAATIGAWAADQIIGVLTGSFDSDFFESGAFDPFGATPEYVLSRHRMRQVYARL